ncbi:FCD domain-containing protein [Microbacterium oryzae]|uniref:FadR/GntR family transcriptional regulator n=1 Tax=Microbacterium oryzae TaxID=743009 RepID=UPI0025AF64CD|nr:FCD domain-containing protein [Microbacterium oryzae]MDN3312095.1 FCD domain-containing protein [Microbacterium oryzae]
MNLLDRLGQSIADGALAAGSVFTIADVQAESGASRSVVREAVGVLASIGMVEPRRRVGVIVTSEHRWEIYDPHLIRWSLSGPRRARQLEALMELRLAVEPLAARLAAERATPDQRTDLLATAEALGELGAAGRGDTLDYLDADVEFHTTLLVASGNPFLAGLVSPITEVLRGRTELGLTPRRPAPGTVEDHIATARAIAEYDSHTAAARSAAQLEQVRREVARTERVDAASF